MNVRLNGAAELRSSLQARNLLILTAGYYPEKER